MSEIVIRGGTVIDGTSSPDPCASAGASAGYGQGRTVPPRLWNSLTKARGS